MGNAVTILVTLMSVFGYSLFAQARGFTEDYSVRSGDFNGDGIRDFFIEPPPPKIVLIAGSVVITVAIRPDVRPFVLQSEQTGDFSIVSDLSAQDLAVLHRWDETAYHIRASDVNSDGVTDLIFLDAGLPAELYGAIVYGPVDRFVEPAGSRVIDKTFIWFFEDLQFFQQHEFYYDFGYVWHCYPTYSIGYDPYYMGSLYPGWDWISLQFVATGMYCVAYFDHELFSPWSLAYSFAWQGADHLAFDLRERAVRAIRRWILREVLRNPRMPPTRRPIPIPIPPTPSEIDEILTEIFGEEDESVAVDGPLVVLVRTMCAIVEEQACEIIIEEALDDILEPLPRGLPSPYPRGSVVIKDEEKADVEQVRVVIGVSESEKKQRDTDWKFCTYSKSNRLTSGLYYYGRTSGPAALSDDEIVRRRDRGHIRMNIYEGYEPAVVDVCLRSGLVGKGVKRGSLQAYTAVRGREQQLIDQVPHGLCAVENRPESLVGNKIRAVARKKAIGCALWFDSNLRIGPMAAFSGRNAFSIPPICIDPPSPPCAP